MIYQHATAATDRAIADALDKVIETAETGHDDDDDDTKRSAGEDR
jgi:hypothetical protein